MNKFKIFLRTSVNKAMIALFKNKGKLIHWLYKKNYLSESA